MEALTINPEIRLRPLRQVEYQRMVDLGMFDGEHVELLHGAVVQMSPIGSPHNEVVSRLMDAFVPALATHARVRVQSSFIVDDGSEPEPDIAVVPLGDYTRENPSRAHLIVEVAESSTKIDRGIKGPLYAAAGVPEYWIVNIPDGIIEIFRQPAHDGYRESFVRRRGEAVTMLEFPDVSFPAERFLVEP